MNRNIVFTVAVLIVAAGIFFANCGAAVPTPPKVSHPFIAQCFRACKICIVSAKGDIEWEYPARYVQDVWKLPNGNTVVSWYGGNPQFFEITPDKKVVWQVYDKRFSAVSGLFLLDVKGDVTKGEVLK